MPSDTAGLQRGGPSLASAGLAFVAVGLIAVVAGAAVLPDLPTIASGGDVEVVGGAAYALSYTGSSGRAWFATAVGIAGLGTAGSYWVLWAREGRGRAGAGAGVRGPNAAFSPRRRRWAGRAAGVLLAVGLAMLVGGVVVIPRDGPAFQAVGPQAYAGVLRGRPVIEAGAIVAVFGAVWIAVAALRTRRTAGRRPDTT